MSITIILIFTWGMFLIYSFLSYRIFFTIDKLKKISYFLLFAVFVTVLFSYAAWTINISFYVTPFFSLLIIIFPALFCTGSIKDRLIVSAIIYCFFINIDICSSVIAYIFSDKPVHIHILPASTPASIISYFISYTIIFFICLKFILIPIQENMKLFGSRFFIRWAGPFLILFLLSNAFFAFIYVKSTVLFITGSAAFFALIAFLVRIAIRNFQFYIKKENERTQLLLQEKQFEQQSAHERQLAKQYEDIRKQNHDIGNHLLTLAYLIDNRHEDAALKYIRNILENTKGYDE